MHTLTEVKKRRVLGILRDDRIATLKHWREPILNHFDNHTTNGFTEGYNTKIKMLKRISYGLRNVEVYWRKMLLGFVPSRSYFHTN